MNATQTLLTIESQLRKAHNPALLCSFGKESLLLLSMLRKSSIPVTLIHLYDRLHPQAEEIIKGWGLDVLSWRPSVRYLIPWNDDLALVSEYSFGSARLPVLRDVVDSTDCELEKLRTDRTKHFDYPFDVTLWGYRRRDELHPVMPLSFRREMPLGPTSLVAPLYDWEAQDVLTAIRPLPYLPVASDAIRMCAKCRLALASGEWDKARALRFFAVRFGYQEAA